MSGPVQTQIRIVHVLPSLEVGGAETVATRLIGGSDRAVFSHHVVTLMPQGELGQVMRSLGVPIHAVAASRSGIPSVRWVLDVASHLRAIDAHVVHCWMYHANLVGGLAAQIARRPPLIWSIRQTNLDLVSIRRRTRMIARAGALLSRRLPSRIVYNADSSRRIHEAFGYRRRGDDVIIPNGFDTEAFRPDPEARASVRKELGLDADALVVGIVARFDPQKDHRNFIGAATLVHAQRPDVWFVLCGRGVDASNTALVEWVRSAGIAGKTVMLGQRSDVARINAAFDVSCMSSMGEGFPNVVGEAMACAVPCVVTDVGAAALLVGDTGRVAPPGNPAALAEAILDLVGMKQVDRQDLGTRARARVRNRFGLQAMVESYQKLWRELAASRPK